MLMQNSVYSGSTENTQNSVWILGKKKKKKVYYFSRCKTLRKNILRRQKSMKKLT